MSLQSVKKKTLRVVSQLMWRFLCNWFNVASWQCKLFIFWLIKTHSCIHIWQNNQQETEQTAPVFRNSHPHCYQAWVTLPVFLLFKCVQCIVGKDERYKRHLLTLPLAHLCGEQEVSFPISTTYITILSVPCVKLFIILLLLFTTQPIMSDVFLYNNSKENRIEFYIYLEDFVGTLCAHCCFVL